MGLNVLWQNFWLSCWVRRELWSWRGVWFWSISPQCTNCHGLCFHSCGCAPPEPESCWFTDSPPKLSQRQAPCVIAPWCLEVVLGFSLWLKLQLLSPTWPVLLAPLQVTGGGYGFKKHKVNSEGAEGLWPVLCRMSEVGVSPMSQMPPLPLLESRAHGDTKVMVLVGCRGGSSSLEITDLGVCSYFKIAVSCFLWKYFPCLPCCQRSDCIT